MEPTIKIRPVTTGGAGYIPDNRLRLPSSKREARLRMYNKISPVQAFTDDTLKDFIRTMLFDRNSASHNPKSIIVDDPYIDGVWAEYLQIPQQYRRSKYKLQKSLYKPTFGGENKQYYKVPMDSASTAELIKDSEMLNVGENKLSDVLFGYNHGQHTVGKGIDPKKGQYTSYFDVWDLNPFTSRYSTVHSNNPIIKYLGWDDAKKRGDLSFGLGKPLPFYDRVYLDDYYGVDSSAKPGTYYGGYLPEVTIETSPGLGFSTNSAGNYINFGVPLLPKRNDYDKK